MTTSLDQQPLTKTAVAARVLEIRNAARRVGQMIDGLDSARKMAGYRGTPGATLREALEEQPQFATVIHDLLGDIDGVSAQLRELLALGDA